MFRSLASIQAISTGARPNVAMERDDLAWPAQVDRDDDRPVQVRFPDFPEALTDADDEWEALAEAADCLAEAVAARMTDGEDIPPPRDCGAAC